MRIVLFLSFLVACEQVAPAGNPLKPVQVKAEPTAPEPSEGSDEAVTQEEEVFSISSEEMQAAVEGTEPPASEDPPANTGEGTAATAAAVVDDEVDKEPSPRPSSGAVQGWPKQVAEAWPVRLVTTVPNASPPRAILGLPDGREVVVNPGSMVPDMGLVVVAISPNSAEVAKILPAGDHAKIESMTLTAQY